MNLDHFLKIDLFLAVSFILLAIALVWRHFSLKLKKNHEHLVFTLQSASMGTWEVDLKTNKLTISPEMMAIWNISEQEFNGNREVFQSKVHPEDLNRMKAAIAFAIKNDTVYELQYRIFPTPDVERWVLSRGRCCFTGKSKTPSRFSGVVLDVTESKRKERDLENALKAREQFLAIAGHELKTPLTSMLLHLQVNEWDVNNRFAEEFTEEKIRTKINRQRQHLHRITFLVDNILDESRISTGKLILRPEKVDLSFMTSQIIEQIKVIAEEAKTELRFTPTKIVEGQWDSFRMEQVLLNLLMNAIRYGNSNPVHIEVDHDEHHAYLIVRDQGIGIKEEDHAKVFKRFERGIIEGRCSGMGLGLYIVHNIVIAHSGQIKLKSELGKGSEFTVMLPLV